MNKKEIHVAAGILKRNGRILAVQRGTGQWKGYWEFPGGKIEENETSIEALVRELSEELKVEILNPSFLTTIRFSYPGFNLVMDCYLCDITQEFTLTEHLDSRWLASDELEDINWLPADYQILPLIKETLE